MNVPRFKSTPVSRWAGEALTEFVNGALDGWGGGVGTGAGTGALTGTTAVGESLTAVNQVLLSVAAVLAAMVGSGIQAVYVWHKTHRFPNPWGPTPTLPPPPAPTP